MTSAATIPFGLYGKIPANADFVHRDLPRTFVTPWDEWLREALSLSRQRLGDAWMSTYLKSPPWRFALDAGVAGPSAWLGVLLSSIDQVQRYYPLTLAVALPESVTLARLRADFDPLLDRLEEIALALVSAERGVDSAVTDIGPIAREIDQRARLSQSLLHWPDRRATVRIDQPKSPPISAMLADDWAVGTPAGASCWWHRGWGHYGAARVVSEGLPPPAGFVAFLDASWASHGWIANA
ncbi:type VI secretion system-associated protein TagF [Microbacteriaceae bacterium K1510]|nr:type VI secretion system-associated protein TagF [Microbacteriaceae bacterium K1510]